MAQGVHSDINVSVFKTRSVKRPPEGRFNISLFPKCFFSLQDKLLLLFDHFQTLDMPPCDCCRDPTHLFRLTFYKVFFFLLSFPSPSPPQLQRRSVIGAAGRSRGGAPCRRFTTAIRSALSQLRLPRPPPSLQIVCDAEFFFPEVSST